MDVNDDGRLKNVFSTDGRSMEANKEFDDVAFDTTYLTSMTCLLLHLLGLTIMDNQFCLDVG